MRKLSFSLLLFSLILLIVALMTTGCATKNERYTAAVALYAQADYATAAKAFKKLGDHEDAVEMAEKCLLLSSWQNPEGAQRLLEEYKEYNDNVDKGRRLLNLEQYVSQLVGHTVRPPSIDDPDLFFSWAMDYCLEQGDAEIFVAVYPYLEETAPASGFSFLSSNLEDYLGQVGALCGLHRDSPRYAAFLMGLDRHEWVSDPLEPIECFCDRALEDETIFALVDKLGLYVPAGEMKEMSFYWDYDLSVSFFGGDDFRANDPQPMTFILLADKDSYFSFNQVSFEYYLPEFSYTNDPDKASVFVYYCSSQDTTQTYYASDGSATATQATAMTEEYTAVDSVTGEVIATVTFSGVLPSSVFYNAKGGGNELFWPEMNDPENEALQNSFMESIADYLHSK